MIDLQLSQKALHAWNTLVEITPNDALECVRRNAPGPAMDDVLQVGIFGYLAAQEGVEEVSNKGW